ncbi:PAS domain S-box-containing protein [Archangium gephyra]|uniref:histidine kinase n=1 Tax=Archangium gephyra TaxID=48 RepID=A0AAC8THH5_9BACT|nr:ATP-binding protein [Archangium gephyra]AKJ04546.1 Phytochrome, two-component sensor histidine kinase [Archangium gephyra]REG37385.1 PAS domain S-box-containing protein [Archangium gephyra]
MKTSQFFSDVSHELRTHLALILGPAETLLAHGHNLTGVQRKDLDVMRRNAMLLLRHVDDLVDIARMDVGRMPLAYTEVELASRVREVARHFEPLALQRRISLEVDAPGPLFVQVDVEKLERVVIHLLSNAFKSTPDGGRIRVAVSGAPGERARLEVEDSGQEGAHGQAGTELGLSLARDFVELHGGFVRVTEAPGGGELFHVELPCRAPEGTPVTRRVPEVAWALEAGLSLRSTLEALTPPVDERTPVEAEARTEDTSRPAVLVVKEHPELHRFLTEALQEDYRVISAFDGQEGLEKARSLRPDIILTGTQLPGLSGESLVAALRQEEALEGVPIVVLSTRDDEALKLKLLHEGAQDYLLKPFSAGEVRVRVRNLVQLKRVREELERRNHELERLRSREEAHYRAILDASPAVVYVKDLQGRYLLVNKAYEAFMRRTREDLLGRTDAQLYSPEVAEAFRRNDLEALRRKTPVELEELAPHADGMHVYRSIKFPMQDTAGQLYALGGISTDITLQKRAEEERERFFQLAPDMFCVAGVDARFRRVNPAFTRVLGWSEEELLAQSFLELVHPEDRERTLQEVADIAQGENALHFENRYLCKDGSWRWLAWRTSPATPDGAIYAAARDITVQREVQDAVRLLNQQLELRVSERTRQLEEANRELESFSYTVSHDLRAPLRHITGFVGLLERHAQGVLDAKAQGYLRTISESARRGGQLVDDLLAFSRMGRVEMRQSRLQLEPLVAEVWEELAPEREGRQLVLEVGPMPEARGDPAMLRLVFKNLLGNAVKYTRPRAEGRVEVRAEAGEDGVVIHVKDNGVGFDMAYEDKLFGVFQRLHRASEFEGTGIGLAHVRRIITRHGGRTWGKGVVGQGATFSFFLPAAPAP